MYWKCLKKGPSAIRKKKPLWARSNAFISSDECVKSFIGDWQVRPFSDQHKRGPSWLPCEDFWNKCETVEVSTVWTAPGHSPFPQSDSLPAEESTEQDGDYHPGKWRYKPPPGGQVKNVYPAANTGLPTKWVSQDPQDAQLSSTSPAHSPQCDKLGHNHCAGQHQLCPWCFV